MSEVRRGSRIRAKFRCLKVTRTWDNQEHIELAPVMPDSGEHCEENKAFWDATPTGKMELTHVGPSPYAPGDFYYIDMRKSEAGKWTLGSVKQYQSGAAEVSFSHYRGEKDWNNPEPGLRNGSLEMYIEPVSTVELFGRPRKQGWVIEVSPAEG